GIKHENRDGAPGYVQGTGEGADYLWVIDPLDGTTNFIHGVPHFAVSIACKDKGRLGHARAPAPVHHATT
ncbi:inositol monophosphatase family protein, partial [Klebsiella pneumoniae]